MSARVIDAEVKQIIETDLDTDPFIKAANLIVTEKLAESGLNDETLMEIERWLAAHFVAIRERQTKSQKIGDASITYFGQDGKGLEATPYGQQVLVMDTTGTLASIGKRKAEFTAIDLGLD